MEERSKIGEPVAVDKAGDLHSSSNTESDHSDITLDWDGPDDPDNPRNWPFAKKLYSVSIPACYSFCLTYGTSVYSAGVEDVMVKFQVNRTVAILGLSLYALGLAFGPVLGAPISETLGRRWTYIIALPSSLLLTMGAGLARNIGGILVCRFLSSLLGSPAIAVGAGTVPDLWDMQRGGAIAGTFFILMPFLGSSIGPLIGGFAVEQQGSWRWAMWTIIMIGGPAWLVSLPMRETYAKIILKERALKRGLPEPPRPPPKEALKTLFTVTLLRPLHMLVSEPIVGWMSLYIAFTFGILFAFFDAFPYTFVRIYGFSLDQVGLTYLSIIVGILLAAIIFAVLDKTLYARAKAWVQKHDPGKVTPPEERLYACMIGSIMIPISLFWFGWTARQDIHWIVPVLAGLPYGCGVVLLFLGTSCYLVDTYLALNAASAIAAMNLLRYSFAAAFPLFTFQMYEKLGIGWASSLLGFISVLMLPIPWVFYQWGPFLRRRSSYETADFSKLGRSS